MRIIERASVPSGTHNEDRVGATHDLAWVIDGATDVVDPPLMGGSSDAAWFAGRLDAALRALATNPPDALEDLLPPLTETLSAAFAQAAQRPPAGRHEHPSASGIVVRRRGRALDYLAIGDCTLILDTPSGARRVGVAEDDAGDPWLADAIRTFHTTRTTPSATAARAHVWPKIISARGTMNTPAGYGVFSITETPARFVHTGTIDLAPGSGALLASDGLMRLVDIYRHMTAAELLRAARATGLVGLLATLRAIEAADAEAVAYPRAKPRDDASGLLLAFD